MESGYWAMRRVYEGTAGASEIRQWVREEGVPPVDVGGGSTRRLDGPVWARHHRTVP